MTKRTRNNEEDITLDPAVEQVMESYEASLAAFMSTLSPLVTRYNELLQAALPHNPKASFYTVDDTEDGEKGEESNNSKTVGASLFAKVKAASNSDKASTNSTPEKSNFPSGDVLSVTAAVDSSPKKRPTSPLLRRPQVKPEVLEELNRTASRILTGDSKSEFPSGFPINANLCNKGIVSNSNGVTVSSEADGASTANEQVCIKAKANRDISVVKNALGNKAKTVLQQPKKDAKTVQQLLEEVECSPLILAQLHLLRKEAEELLTTFDRIHDWIAMKVPAMKEGDNIVVSVMAAVIGEISSISSAITQNVSNFEQQFISERGKLEVEYLLNPGSDTIKSLIASHDASKWDDVEAAWRLLVRAVIIIHSRLAKNMKTLKTPQEKRINMSL